MASEVNEASALRFALVIENRGLADLEPGIREHLGDLVLIEVGGQVAHEDVARLVLRLILLRLVLRLVIVVVIGASSRRMRRINAALIEVL